MGGMFAVVRVLIFLLSAGDGRFIGRRRDVTSELGMFKACLQEARGRAENRFPHAIKEKTRLRTAFQLVLTVALENAVANFMQDVAWWLSIRAPPRHRLRFSRHTLAFPLFQHNHGTNTETLYVSNALSATERFRLGLPPTANLASRPRPPFLEPWTATIPDELLLADALHYRDNGQNLHSCLV
jgi:hypothetical protein